MAVATPAFAGELKIFQEAPEVDGSGKLSGGAKATKEIASVAGEETWNVHMWAKLDKGAPGPLYAEAFGKLNGKKYLAGRFEKSDYEGDKYLMWTLELTGNLGFNRDREYTIELNQVDAKNKNVTLASSKLTLKYTEAAAEEDDDDDDEGGSDEGGSDDGNSSEQDAHDTLAGAEGGGDGPPPVTPPGKKKGCSVDPVQHGTPALLGLFVLGVLAAGRRRRD